MRLQLHARTEVTADWDFLSLKKTGVVTSAVALSFQLGKDADSPPFIAIKFDRIFETITSHIAFLLHDTSTHTDTHTHRAILGKI